MGTPSAGIQHVGERRGVTAWRGWRRRSAATMAAQFAEGDVEVVVDHQVVVFG
jgi:hypothetical protein